MLPCGGETEWAKPVTSSHLGWVHDTDTWRLNKILEKSQFNGQGL